MIVINIIKNTLNTLNTLQRFNFHNSYLLFSMDSSSSSSDISSSSSDNNISQELKESVQEKIKINENFKTLIPHNKDGFNLEQDATGMAAFFKDGEVVDYEDVFSTLYIKFDSYNRIIHLNQTKYNKQLYTYYDNFDDEGDDESDNYEEIIKQNNTIINISEFITDKISYYVAKKLSKNKQEKQIEQILNKINIKFVLCKSCGIYSNVSNVSNTLTFTFNSNEAAQIMESVIKELQNFGTVSLYYRQGVYSYDIDITNVATKDSELHITCDNSLEILTYLNDNKHYLTFIITNNETNKICSLRDEPKNEKVIQLAVNNIVSEESIKKGSESIQGKGDEDAPQKDKTEKSDEQESAPGKTLATEQKDTSKGKTQDGQKSSDIKESKTEEGEGEQIETKEVSKEKHTTPKKSIKKEQKDTENNKSNDKISKESKPEETSETQKEDIEKGSTNNVDNDSNNQITKSIGNGGPKQDKNGEKQGDEDKKEQKDTENSIGNGKIDDDTIQSTHSQPETQKEDIEKGSTSNDKLKGSEEDEETEPDSEGENDQESNKDNDKTKKKTTIKKKNNKSWFANTWTLIGVGAVALTSVVCGCLYTFKKDPKQSTSQENQQRKTGNKTVAAR